MTSQPTTFRLYGVSQEYKIIEKVGRGTYGTVYKAKNIKTGQLVAIKKIENKDPKAHAEGFPITALREINLLKAMDHKNIVKLKQIITSKPQKRNSFRGSTFLVFEYMDHDFAGLFRHKIKYTTPEIKCIIQQILQGVKYLHDSKILHRDIKSANLLLNNKGQVKIADFGLGRRFRPDCTYTSKVVTLWYRAPELLLGTKQYTEKVDIWSVGCIMAEFLMGEVLFRRDTEFAQIQRIYEVCGGLEENNFLEAKEYACYNDLKPQLTINLKRLVETIRKINPAVDNLTMEFLSGMLSLNPKFRFTCQEALNHEYFKQIPLPCKPLQICRLDMQYHQMYREPKPAQRRPDDQSDYKKPPQKFDNEKQPYGLSRKPSKDLLSRDSKDFRPRDSRDSRDSRLPPPPPPRDIRDSKDFPPRPRSSQRESTNDKKKMEVERDRSRERERERERWPREDKDKLERDRVDRERTDREKTDRERVDRERVDRERTDRERVDRERTDRERVDRERVDRERSDRQRVDRERADRDRIEKDRLDRQRIDKERTDRERAERERVDRQRLDRQRIDREKLDKIERQRTAATTERQRAERTVPERQKSARIEKDTRVAKEPSDRYVSERNDRDRNDRDRGDRDRDRPRDYREREKSRSRGRYEKDWSRYREERSRSKERSRSRSRRKEDRYRDRSRDRDHRPRDRQDDRRQFRDRDYRESDYKGHKRYDDDDRGGKYDKDRGYYRRDDRRYEGDDYRKNQDRDRYQSKRAGDARDKLQKPKEQGDKDYREKGGYKDRNYRQRSPRKGKRSGSKSKQRSPRDSKKSNTHR